MFVSHMAHFRFHRCTRPLHAFAQLLVEHCLHDRFVTHGVLCLMRYALIISPSHALHAELSAQYALNGAPFIVRCALWAVLFVLRALLFA